MKRASISELKAKLSRYLAAVKAGEEVIVTERGRPVARIGPVQGERGQDARLAQLVRAGQVRPPRKTGPPVDPDTLERPGDPEGRGLELLLEERASAR